MPNNQGIWRPNEQPEKRKSGGIIATDPPAPSGPYQDSVASGVWSLSEALTYSKAGLWPTAGNSAP